ncbi:MAG: hypothetical protein PHS54_00255 [Clostridia bacterium]|nr:hypothetical protein [Clostridia bacterium]
MNTYKGNIEHLEPDQIFVFGSNTQGRHGAGAALVALQKFGAIYGQSAGWQGNSYAIITKDLTKNIHPSITPERIIEQIQQLYLHARVSLKEFFIAYKGTGKLLCGYTPQQMAKMFACEDIPNNIIFEETFAKLVKENL